MAEYSRKAIHKIIMESQVGDKQVDIDDRTSAAYRDVRNLMLGGPTSKADTKDMLPDFHIFCIERDDYSVQRTAMKHIEMGGPNAIYVAQCLANSLEDLLYAYSIDLETHLERTWQGAMMKQHLPASELPCRIEESRQMMASALGHVMARTIDVCGRLLALPNPALKQLGVKRQRLLTAFRIILDGSEQSSQEFDTAAQTIRRAIEAIRFSPPIPVSSDDDDTKGVTMLDAALILNDHDRELANNTKERWLQQTRIARPSNIGGAPEHAQRPMFRPHELVAFIEKIDGKHVVSKKNLLIQLISLARNPLSKTPTNETGKTGSI